MTAEQLSAERLSASRLEELLGKVTPPRVSGDWFHEVDFDGYSVNDYDWELSKLTYSLARRVLAAEKLIAKMDEVIERRHIIVLVPDEEIDELDVLDAAYREAKFGRKTANSA